MSPPRPEPNLPPFDPAAPPPARVRVALGERAYDVAFASDLGAGLVEALAELGRAPDRVLLLGDDATRAPWGELAERAIQAAGWGEKMASRWFACGEEAKNASSLVALWNACLESQATRQSVVVALGGGVMGDMAGFAAATYQRGVRFVQIPTTLLAMVDSSVGGKTGVNLPGGKNLVGAFHQPSAVVIATETLSTLPDAELRAGLAEVAKAGVIADAAFFAWLEINAAKLLARDADALRRAIARSVEIKAEVVRLDEREENGLREILNFGHTFGHALESATNYAKFRHGEAVAIGMVAAGELARQLGDAGWTADHQRRLVGLLEALRLPTSFAGAASVEALMAKMKSDKKVRDGSLRFVLPTTLGRAETRGGIDPALVREVLRGLGAAC